MSNQTPLVIEHRDDLGWNPVGQSDTLEQALDLIKRYARRSKSVMTFRILLDGSECNTLFAAMGKVTWQPSLAERYATSE